MSAEAPENFAARPVTAGFSSLENSPRMRSSTCSTEPIWVNVPRPSSAARVIRKVFGQEHDLPDVIGIAAAVGQRRAHRRYHFRAASRLQRADERRRMTDMSGIG